MWDLNNAANLSDLNGLGLTGKHITFDKDNIPESEIDEDHYQKFIESYYDEADPDLKIEKEENPDFKPKPSDFEKFMEARVNVNGIDDELTTPLTKKIGTFEVAFNTLLMEHNERVSFFNDNVKKWANTQDEAQLTFGETLLKQLEETYRQIVPVKELFDRLDTSIIEYSLKIKN